MGKNGGEGQSRGSKSVSSIRPSMLRIRIPSRKDPIADTMHSHAHAALSKFKHAEGPTTRPFKTKNAVRKGTKLIIKPGRIIAPGR